MQRSILAYAAVVAFAGFAASAHADDISVETTPFVSTASRAAVQAELQQAQAGRVNGWVRYYSPQPVLGSAKTRADAIAEYLRSRDETSALTSEDSGSAWLSTRVPFTAQPALAGQPVNAQ